MRMRRIKRKNQRVYGCAAEHACGGCGCRREENNRVVRVWGEVPQFDFTPKDHIELAESLGLVDYQRGAKIGGSGFWIYKGNGALLEWFD